MPDDDLEVRAAWLYYIHGFGQEEVARKLSISRSKVTRILSNAREQGVVKIGIEHETAETLALSDWIASEYRVRDCLLTPVSVYYDDSDIVERFAQRSVGIVAANHVGRRILATRAVTIGLGAGRTVAEMINAFAPIAKPDARVVSIVGASANDDGNGAYPLTLKFANALGGAPVLFPVPMTVHDARVHEALLREPAVAAARAVLESADFLVLGCGDCSDQATYFGSAQIPAEGRAQVRAAGGVAEIAGLFLDAEGRPVDVEFNRTRTGPTLELMRRADAIVVAAGRRKAEALKAVIKAGLAKTIVIDMSVAEELAKGARRALFDAVASPV